MTPDEVYSLIAAGNRRCQVAATSMNERSNRAHRIFIVTVAFSKYVAAFETAQNYRSTRMQTRARTSGKASRHQVTQTHSTPS